MKRKKELRRLKRSDNKLWLSGKSDMPKDEIDKMLTSLFHQCIKKVD